MYEYYDDTSKLPIVKSPIKENKKSKKSLEISSERRSKK
jgi:hypothetical protein